MHIKKLKLVIFLFQLILILVLFSHLAYKLYGYGPTFDDPDPDGYVSYAYGLVETGNIQHHRRRLGYPLIMVAVAHDEIAQLTTTTHASFFRINTDVIRSQAVAIKMFWFHFFLTIAFVACTTGIIWYFFGYPVAVVYSMIMAHNSYFSRDAIVMLADLPLVVMFYVTCAMGFLFLRSINKLKLLYAGLFSLGCVFSMAIHPSSYMLLQILIFSLCVVYVFKNIRVTSFVNLVKLIKGLITPLIVLAALAFACKEFVVYGLEKNVRQNYLHAPEASASSRNFLESWVGFRMLLCLPPRSQSETLDFNIEMLKSKIAMRTGYPIDAVVPPGYYAEFLPLIDGKTIASDRWQNRISQHPFAILGCAASEFRAKYNILIRNLTPFTDFYREKTWITPNYPFNNGGTRDELFWSTGVNLFHVLQADAPASTVLYAAIIEVTRIIIVIVLTFGGLIMIGRRFPSIGLAIALGLLVWICLLPIALPLETRYLMTFLPAIYTGQAILIVWVFGSVFSFSAKRLSKMFSLFNRANP